MNIDSLITSINEEDIVTETEVRTKFANYFFRLLDFPDSLRADEFPIYANEGRTQLHAKSTDIIFFSSPEYNNYRTRNDVSWVHEHSLLVIELKKPSVKNDAEPQAQFYSIWARSKYYIVTNGLEISFYIMKEFTKDELILKCKIQELSNHWSDIYTVFNYNSVLNDYKKLNENNNPKKDIFFHYCTNLYNSGNINNSLHLAQEIQSNSNDVNKSILKEDLMNLTTKIKNEPILLLGEAGIGKSYNLRNIAANLVFERMKDKLKPLPIIIQGHLWGKRYDNIPEAIEYELKPYIPNLPNHLITKMIQNSSIYLIFDAYDELSSKEDELLSDIDRFLQHNSKLIVSSRPYAIDNSMKRKLSTYTIQPLSDSSIDLFITKKLNKSFRALKHQIDTSLIDLIHYPLFLYMFVEIVEKSIKFEMPSNKASLYSNYLERIIEKAQRRTNSKISSSIIEKILGTIARNMYDGLLDKRVFSEIILTESNISLSGSIEKLLLKTDIVSIKDSIVDFFHPSMKEYYLGIYYLSLNSNEFENVVNDNINKDKYYPIFEFISGLLLNRKRQDSYLDLIEGKNLLLLTKCIKARYKFKDYSFSNDLNYVNDYFRRIKYSYLSIVNSHFSTFKKSLFPWNSFPELQDDFCIEGSYDDSPAIWFKFKPNENDCDLEITYLEGKPKIVPSGQKDSIPTPIISLTSNDGRYFYDLNLTGHGIDSAREIALDSIKKQILQLLDKNILPFNNSYPVMAEYIESVLRNLKSYRNQVDDFKEIPDLSLYINSVNEIIETLEPISNITGINIRSYNPPELNIYITNLYLLQLQKNDISLDEILIPRNDKKMSDLGNVQSCFNWELYTNDQLKKRIRKYFDLYQKSYRDEVLTCFPTLLDSFQLYRIGPIRYDIDLVIKSNERFYGSVIEKWEPVKSGEDYSTKICLYGDEYTEEPFSDDFFNVMSRKLKSFGRNAYSIPGTSNGLLEIYFSENLLTQNIYKKIKDEFEDIFK